MPTQSASSDAEIFTYGYTTDSALLGTVTFRNRPVTTWA